MAAIVPEKMRPQLPKRVSEMERGQKALVPMHAVMVDKVTHEIYLSNATAIGLPTDAGFCVELTIDPAGEFHLDWQHKPYEFRPSQFQDMSGWLVLQEGKALDSKISPIASVINWPE